MPSTLSISHLTKTYASGLQALKDVSLEVRRGEIFALLGPNGAGKTTTLRMLYSLLKPERGTARIDGYDTSLARLEAQRRIGALPDARGLYPRLTARENIRYYGRLHGLRGPSLEASIDHLIDLLDLGALADRRTDGFSTGERLKVAIARALVHSPQQVLFDEPTNGLDVMSTRAMRDFIRRLREEGKCVLLSSHIMQEVAALCDHVVIIYRGKVVAEGTPEELRRRTGLENLEDAFVNVIGSEEGLER
jgi:sodium transport system ATP-binding protein